MTWIAVLAREVGRDQGIRRSDYQCVRIARYATEIRDREVAVRIGDCRSQHGVGATNRKQVNHRAGAGGTSELGCGIFVNPGVLVTKLNVGVAGAVGFVGDVIPDTWRVNESVTLLLSAPASSVV